MAPLSFCLRESAQKRPRPGDPGRGGVLREQVRRDGISPIPPGEKPVYFTGRTLICMELFCALMLRMTICVPVWGFITLPCGLVGS